MRSAKKRSGRPRGVPGVVPPGVRPAAGAARSSLRRRLGTLRATTVAILQSALGAGLAWFLAHDVAGHARPFFAPIAATIALGLAPGRRARRAVEMIVGVAVGVAMGDLLIGWIGVDAWQIALVVALAMMAAVIGGGGPLVVGQAAASSILIVALPTHGTGLVPTRMVDALIGGTVGIVVVAVLPRNPVRASDRALRPVFDELAATLEAIAAALERRDRSLAEAALARGRAMEGMTAEMDDALELAEETARVAPAWWSARQQVATYAHAATHADRAVRNCHVLARAAIRAIDVDAKIAPDTTEGIRLLAEGARRAAPSVPSGARNDAASAILEGVERVERARLANRGLALAAIVAQVRSTASDLLQSLGVDQDTAIRRVRRASARASHGPSVQ